MTAALTKPGDRITADHGLFRLTRQMSTCGGISIRVHCGPAEVHALANHFPRGRFGAARIWWQEIADSADLGLHEDVIVARLRALTDAAEAAEAGLR